MIPNIDVKCLFGDASEERGMADTQILEAACEVGFMSISGVPFAEDTSPEVRRSMLRLFGIRGAEQRAYWKRNFAPENPNLYRGWFPLESDAHGAREGFEIGPDLVRNLPSDGSDDLLYEPSVLPTEERLPGWRTDAARYYRAMERVGYALLASLSRGLGISDGYFRGVFEDGISTLRLVRYPAPADTRLPETDEPIVCGAHVDSGLVTILAQCDAEGLQARGADGTWLDIAPEPGAFVVNFGGLLARWTGGRVRATMHRVKSNGQERHSVPFFFEPRPYAVIEPLPIPGVEPFAPFQFGDHLWATTTKFPENRGLGYLRPARAPYQDPFAEGDT